MEGHIYLILPPTANPEGPRIDFVITNSSNGHKLAIECDGPTHFKDEMAQELGIYIQSDIERQEILESAGWSFYRVKYSDWVDEKRDKGRIITDIIDKLT